jgi:hypothetical protein
MVAAFEIEAIERGLDQIAVIYSFVQRVLVKSPKNTKARPFE